MEESVLNSVSFFGFGIHLLERLPKFILITECSRSENIAHSKLNKMTVQEFLSILTLHLPLLGTRILLSTFQLHHIRK